MHRKCLEGRYFLTVKDSIFWGLEEGGGRGGASSVGGGRGGACACA